MKNRIDATLYNCVDCQKLTRDTGYGEKYTGMCKRCYQIAELENSLSDGDIDEEEYNEAVLKL